MEAQSGASVRRLNTGPKEPCLIVLNEAEEAMIVAFRRHTLLPLDDCLYALQPSIPHLTRSALHRCLQRHGPFQASVTPSSTRGFGIKTMAY